MSILRNIYNAFYNNLIGDGAYVRIIKGCIYTILIFAVALALGLLLSAGLTFLRTCKNRFWAAVGCGAAFLLKGTPVTVALMLWYYTFLGGMHRGGLIVAFLALGLYAGGHLSDILVRAILRENKMRSETVNKRARQEFFTALLPFVTEQSLFEIKRLCTFLLQMSTFVGTIGVMDLMQVLLGQGMKNKAPFFAMGCAAVFYLVIELILEGVFAWIGKKITGEED